MNYPTTEDGWVFGSFHIKKVKMDIPEIGQMATIAKANYSEVTGKVVKVSNQEITLGFTNGIKGVETNIWVTIEDEQGLVHTGSLVKKKSEKKLA